MQSNSGLVEFQLYVIWMNLIRLLVTVLSISQQFAALLFSLVFYTGKISILIKGRAMKNRWIVIWSLLGGFFSLILSACSSAPVQQSADDMSSDVQIESEMAQVSTPSMTASRTSASLSNNKVKDEQRLGTKWGDEISSSVKPVNLKRLSSTPIAESQIRYAGKDFSGRSINSISLAAGKVSFSVKDERGRNLALYRDGQQYFLSANDGQSYVLHYTNNSPQTFEVVASVDGLDVLNGQRASRYNSGYVLWPYSHLDIEGFRKSNSAVASFTFSKPKDSYAAHSTSGSINNTGVIGTVIYELNAPRDQVKPTSQYAPPPNAFPAD